ncbi:MAG: hypothetical protein GY778_03545 [bacterium]|nr:hypothetical protein [bacterium]
MIRFVHRFFVVVLTLLAIVTVVLAILSYYEPMGFGLLEPTWFSRAVDGYPSRAARSSAARIHLSRLPGASNPSLYRVHTFVGAWGGRIRVIRKTAPFQTPLGRFSLTGSPQKLECAEWWEESWPRYVRSPSYSRRPNTNWSLLTIYPDRRGPGFVFDMLETSIWLPLVLFSVYPAIAAICSVRRPLRRRRRRRKGLCVGCAYDLTGNESRICPECGQPTGDAG